MRIPVGGPATNKSSDEYMKQRDIVPWRRYVQTLSEIIVAELRTEGYSAGLEFIRNMALGERSVWIYEKMAVVQAASEMSETDARTQFTGEPYPNDREIADSMFFFLIEMLRALGRSVAAHRDERPGYFESLFVRQKDDAAAVRQAAEEARRIREAAADEARKMLNDAKAESERILNEARAVRSQAQNMRDEAENAATAFREQARAQAERQYEEQKEQFRPRAIREMLDEFRAEELSDRNEGERTAMCEALNRTRSDVCGEITRMQAGLNDLFSDMKNRMNTELIKWREEIYRLETMDLATCYVSLHNIISSIDRKIAEEAVRAEDDDQPVNEVIRNIRKNLGRFEKQMRKAMLGVGLDVYTPEPQEKFDPALHTLPYSVDGDDDRCIGRVISGCTRPGIRYLDAATGNYEAMIRADVTIEDGGHAE